MKITDITLTFLKIGKGLLRIQTDAGVEGWTEAPGRNPGVPGGEYGYYSGRVFEAYLESIIKPVLIGEDPLQIERHWETLALGKDEKLFKLPADVVGVIDVALWDLMGKETGLPVYALMGGAVRRDIELYWSTGSGWRLHPDEMLNLVEKGRVNRMPSDGGSRAWCCSAIQTSCNQTSSALVARLRSSESLTWRPRWTSR